MTRLDFRQSVIRPSDPPPRRKRADSFFPKVKQKVVPTFLYFCQTFQLIYKGGLISKEQFLTAKFLKKKGFHYKIFISEFDLFFL